MPERSAGSPGGLPRLEPCKTVRAGVLDVAYYEAGPAGGDAVLLLHGFPYDIHSYAEVIPPLASAGLRVIVPYLRGFGPTRFADPATPRSGQQGALGADVIDLLDALGIPRAVLAGYDWGGRGACVAAALWPERCAGLVSVNEGGYLIMDIAAAANPLRPELEAGLWFFFYFATERGRRGLAANRYDLGKLLWSQLSPSWHFDDATFDRTAPVYDNDDYVDVVIHFFRHRLGLAPGYPAHDDIEKRLLSCHPSPSRPSPWTARRADPTFLPPTAPHQRRTSRVRGPTAGSRAPGITCRRKLLRRSPRRYLIWLLVGEGLDGRAEAVAGGAPDHRALQWSVGGVHDEPALDFRGKAASNTAFGVEIRGTVKERNLTAHFLFLLGLCVSFGLGGIA